MTGASTTSTQLPALQSSSTTATQVYTWIILYNWSSYKYEHTNL